MSIVDGNPVNAAYHNSRMMSKTTDDTAVNVITLNNTTDANSGAQVDNIQQRMNELQTQTGQVDGDANNLVYSSNNALIDSQNHKQGLEALDAKFSNISIDELIDVDISTVTPTNGQVLKWVAANSRFEPANDDSGSGVNNLTDLNDVTIAGVADNNLLQYNSGTSNWENVSGPSGAIIGDSDTQTLTNKTISSASNTFTIPLNDLSDVSAAAPNNGDVLTYNNGTGNWEASAPSGGGGFVSISTESANFTPSDKNCYIVDVSGGAISVNLPAPSSLFQFTIKITGDAFTNNVTLTRNAAENIEGSASNYVINNELGAYDVISNGTDWFII